MNSLDTTGLLHRFIRALFRARPTHDLDVIWRDLVKETEAHVLASISNARRRSWLPYSERVRIVLAGAIEASVRLVLGRRISQVDAAALARQGTLAIVFDRLDARFRITRGDA